MYNMLLANIHFPPDTREHHHKVFIVDHPLCEVYFDFGVEASLYEWGGVENCGPGRRDDDVDSSDRFRAEMEKMNASEKCDVTVPFQPELLRFLGDMAAEALEKRGDYWVFISFFHNDEETLEMAEAEEKEQALDRKVEWLLSLGQFPFIRPVEIPRRDIVKFELLQDLFRQYTSET